MDNNLDMVFSALSDPTRRAIIERLAARPAAVSELYAPHDMALPSFLKHLGKLERAGMIFSEKKGRVRTVHLKRDAISHAEDWLNYQRKLWGGRIDRLSALAEQLEKDSKNA